MVFVGTRGDVPRPRDFFNFQLFDEQFFLIHGTDGAIRCIVDRCSHQIARLFSERTGKCAASIVCPNHQWAYNINDGSDRNATRMGADYTASPDGNSRALKQIALAEVAGMLFACLDENADRYDMVEIAEIVAPYTDPFPLQKGGYKLAHHLRETNKSITFDGAPASEKLIGPFSDYDPNTLSMWFNPNAWVHFTSDHIATNWVFALGPEKCALYSSWIVHEDAVEGDDYVVEHLTEVWKITNAEDVGLFKSMADGAKSAYYRPGPFAPDEQHCI